MILPRLAVVAAIVGIVGGSLATTSAADVVAAPSEPTSCEATVPGLSRHGSTGEVPVLFVHGWTGSGEDWTAAPIDLAIDRDIEAHGRTLLEQVDRIERADPWVLDYHDTSTRWVDDPEGGGPLVAAAIDCLYEATGHPVGVIAHSMGGLATRWAAAADGREARIAAVATFGTPHLGSDVARVLAAALGVSDEPSVADAMTPGLIWILRACGLLTGVHADACAPLPSAITAFDSPAGRALRTGSTQLANLPDWPSTLPVLAIGGRIEIVAQGSAGLFYQDIATFDVGDGIVPTSSAIDRGTETWSGTCRHNAKAGYSISDDLGQLLGVHYDDNDERSVFELGWTPCWHGRLMRGVELTVQALGFIDDWLPQLGYAMPAMCGFESATWPDLAHPDNAVRAPAEASAQLHEGDLDGDGRADQVLAATCIEGTVAAGRSLHAFDADRRPLGEIPIGADLDQQFGERPNPDLFSNIEIADGVISFDVAVWQPGDLVCCASANAAASYRYTGGGFELVDLRTAVLPCSPGRIAADLGAQVEVLEGLCLDGWAYVGTGELGDSQFIARLVDDEWTSYTAFPNQLCRSEVLAEGMPQRIVDRVNWVCERPAAAGEAPVVSWDGVWRPPAGPGRVVKLGEFGEQVRWLQDALALRGYAVDVDSYFGEGTEAAVRQFQRDRRLTVNGIATEEVWNQFGE